MFRLAAKLMIFTAVFLGAFVFLSDSKVSAKVCNWAPGNDWGITTGYNSHGMAGLRVHAQTATGQPLNVAFELSSDIPGKRGIIDGHDVDARIFQMPVGEAGRDKQHWFKTGETIHSGSDTEQCDGWTVLGPGTYQENIGSEWYSSIRQWGNRWVLDCQQPDGDGLISTNFWISDIAAPGGQSGRWAVYVDGNLRTNDLYSNPMDDAPFNVVNGETKRIDMIWYPAFPPDDGDGPSTNGGECNLIRFLIPNDHQDGQGGASNQSEYSIYVNDGGTPGHPAEAGSPDYQEPNVYGAPPGPWVDYHGFATEPQHGGGHIEKNLRLDNKVVSGTLRYTVVIYDRFTNSNDNHVLKVRSRFTRVIDGCYQAVCSIQINANVPGKGPDSNAVQAGQKFGGTIRITNTGVNNLPSALVTNSGNFQLAATTGWFGGLRPLTLPTNIPPGQTRTINLASFDFIAPNSVGSYNLGVYPDFWGRGGIGPGCNAAINTYKQFSLNVSAEVRLNPTVEDPATAVFTGRAAHSSVPPEVGNFRVNYNASARRTPFGSGEVVLQNRSGFDPTPVPYSFTYNVPSPKNAGDKYYLNFCVSQASGWIGPNNDFGQTAGACSNDDDFVHDKPYLHVYGADVIAGSSFKDGGVCSPSATGAGINAYRSPTKGGSGVQFAAMAFGAISGFRSASTSSNPPDYLTFANTDAGEGGNYNGDAICAHDFYSKMDNPATISASAINANGVGEGHSFRDGHLTVTGGTLSANKKSAIFVNGDVFIKGNINFPLGSYLAIVARGNIYIDNSVQVISGLYIAQARDDSTGGNIYTCVNPASNQPYGTPELYTHCRTQLRINGAFVAENVRFGRVSNSLRDSAAGEPVGASRAAEVFNFTPEMYLYSVLFGDDTATDQPYDYITTLPPVL